MAGDLTEIDQSLPQNEPSFLRNSLALSDNKKVYEETIDRIKEMSGNLYPGSFVELDSYGIGIEPDDLGDGRLLPAEAVAFELLLTEYRALMSGYDHFMDDEQTHSKMYQILGGEPRNVIEGLESFGNYLKTAAAIREYLLTKGEPPSEGRIMIGNCEYSRKLFLQLQKALKQDQMTLGQNIVTQIINSQPSLDPNTPMNIKAEFADEQHGIVLASKLYLEVLQLASQDLPRSQYLKKLS